MNAKIFPAMGKIPHALVPSAREVRRRQTRTNGIVLARSLLSAQRERSIVVVAEQKTINRWLDLIQAEYREMPGLHLTKPQVQRLWALEPHVCDELLDALVATEFLKITPRQAYVLAAGVRR
jgi:hypothetical protein